MSFRTRFDWIDRLGSCIQAIVPSQTGAGTKAGKHRKILKKWRNHMAMVDKIAVIGAGLVGRGWAIVCARANRRVALYDSNPEALPLAMQVIEGNLRDLFSFGLIGVEPDRLLERIEPTSNLAEAVGGVSHVQECALERVELKRELFTQLDRLAHPEAAIASSSSGLPASTFTEHLPGRAR